MFGSILTRLADAELRIDLLTNVLENLQAEEATLEKVIGLVIQDNIRLHAELSAAVSEADLSKVQAVADSIHAQAGALQNLLTPPAPAPVAAAPAAPVEAAPAPAAEPAPVAAEPAPAAPAA